jgi:hypothetical protein
MEVRKRTVVLQVLMLFTLLLAGCGSDGGGDFVAVTGNGSNGPGPTPPDPPRPGTVGDLVFSFTKAQSALAPSPTLALEYDFFDVNEGLVFSAESIFATSVTIRDVPITAIRAQVRAYGPGGVPLGVLSVPVQVRAGQATTLDLSGAVFAPVTLDELQVTPSELELQLPTNSTATLSLSGVFSTGDEVEFSLQTGGLATYSSADPTVATVDATGLVTALKAGTTQLETRFTIYGMSATAGPVLVRVVGENPPVTPARLVLDPGSVDLVVGATATVKASYFPPDASTGTDVSGSTTGVSSTAGVTFDKGVLLVSTATIAPTTATVTVSYTENGQTVTAPLTVNIRLQPSPPVPVGQLEVEPATLTFSSGGRRDPSGIGVFRAYFVPPGSAQRLDVTESITVDWSDFSTPSVNAGSYSYEYRTVPLLGLGEEYGTVYASRSGPTPAFGTTATMTVSYATGGVTYQDTVATTIGQPVVRDVDFAIAPGGTLKLPVRTKDFPMLGFLNYTNGLRQALPSCGCPDPFGNWYEVAIQKPDSTNARIDDGSLYGVQVLDTRGVAGAAQVTVFQYSIFSPGGTPLGSFTLQVLDNITTVDVALAPASISVDQRAPYTVTATYSDGNTQDMTAAWAVAIPAADRAFIRVGFESGGPERVYTGMVRGLQVTTSPVTLRLRSFNNQLFAFGGGVTRAFTNRLASVTVTAVDPSFP